jgi:hypothetical protein
VRHARAREAGIEDLVAGHAAPGVAPPLIREGAAKAGSAHVLRDSVLIEQAERAEGLDDDDLGRLRERHAARDAGAGSERTES